MFHFNTTPVTQGLNTMHIPAGAFNCGNGPVAEFTCTFTYEASTPTPTRDGDCIRQLVHTDVTATDSYTYFDTETFTDAETGANA